MGTKVENAVNLLAAKSLNINDWETCLKYQPVLKDNNLQASTNFRKLKNTMDNDRNLESIKKAMLEHDHLFKQQVKELHRVYNVQIMLMNELKHKVKVPAQPRAGNGYCYEENLIKQGNSETDSEAHDQGKTRHRGTNSCSNCDEEEAEIELTLSTGSWKNGNKSMTEKYHHPHYLHSNSNVDKGLLNSIKQSPSQEDCGETLVKSDQNRKRPHWLLRSLSSPNT